MGTVGACEGAGGMLFDVPAVCPTPIKISPASRTVGNRPKPRSGCEFSSSWEVSVIGTIWPLPSTALPGSEGVKETMEAFDRSCAFSARM